MPDLSETATSTTAARAAESNLYTESAVDATKFHTALDAELRETPGDQAPPPVSYWMPDKSDLVALGYPDAALAGVWLPPNLVSANAHAHAWGDVVAYRNTLVGLPLPTAASSGAAPATSPAAGGQAPVKAGAPAAPAHPLAPAAPAPGAPAAPAHSPAN